MDPDAQIRGELRSKVADNLSLLTQFAAIDPNMGDYNTTVFSATRAPGIGERGRAPGVEARFALTGKHDDRDFNRRCQRPLHAWQEFRNRRQHHGAAPG